MARYVLCVRVRACVRARARVRACAWGCVSTVYMCNNCYFCVKRGKKYGNICIAVDFENKSDLCG